MKRHSKAFADRRHYTWREALAACEQGCINDVFAANPSSLSLESHRGSKTWTLGLTIADALALAYGRTEWKQGRAEIEKRAREQATHHLRLRPALDYAYAVEGQWFDVAAVCEGRPEQWVREEHTSTGDRSAVRLLVDITVAYGVDAHTMCERMYAIASAALTMQGAGVPVEVVVVYVTERVRSQALLYSVQVNNAGEMLDMRRLVAVAHPSFFRRIGFRLLEITDDDRVAHANPHYGIVTGLGDANAKAEFGPHAFHYIPALCGYNLEPTIEALNAILRARVLR